MSRRTPSQRGQQRTASQVNNARPRLTLLSEEQKEQVHSYALRILAGTGVRVDSPGVLRFLEDKLGTRAKADVLRLPAEVVEEAIRTAPKIIEVYDRAGNLVFRLGDRWSFRRFGRGGAGCRFRFRFRRCLLAAGHHKR